MRNNKKEMLDDKEKKGLFFVEGVFKRFFFNGSGKVDNICVSDLRTYWVLSSSLIF